MLHEARLRDLSFTALMCACGAWSDLCLYSVFYSGKPIHLLELIFALEPNLSSAHSCKDLHQDAYVDMVHTTLAAV